MASPLTVQLKLELQTAQGETALKRFEAAIDAALQKIGRTDGDIGLIKKMAAEVEAGKAKIDELPLRFRQDVAEIARIGKGVKLLDEVGINKSHAAIRAEIERLKQSFSSLKAANLLPRAELEQAATRTRAAIRALGEQMNGAQTHGAGLAQTFGRLQLAASLFMGALSGNAVIRMADEMTLLQARLALSEGSTRAAKERMAELMAIANRAGVDIGAVAGGYVKMADSVRKAGGSTKDTRAGESPGTAAGVCCHSRQRHCHGCPTASCWPAAVPKWMPTRTPSTASS